MHDTGRPPVPIRVDQEAPRRAARPAHSRVLAVAAGALVALVAASAAAGGPGDAVALTGPGEYVIGTGQGSGPYDTARGFFTGTGGVEVCTFVDIPSLQGLRYRVSLRSWSAGVTSPAGDPVDPSLWGLRLRSVENGLPAGLLYDLRYGLGLTPTGFPDATWATQELEDVSGTLETDQDVFACYGTWTSGIHFGLRFDPGSEVVTSGDDGQSWTVEPGFKMDWQIGVEVAFADSPSTTYYSTAVADVGGVNSQFESEYNVRYVSPSFAGFQLGATYTPREDRAGSPFQETTAAFGAGGQHRWKPSIEGFVGSAILELEETDDLEPQLAAVQTVRGGSPLMIESVITSTLSDGRVFGQWFPAFTDSDAVGAGERALFHTTHDPSRYRVNLGVMALADGTTVAVTPVDPIDTARAAAHTVTLNRGENLQINDVHAFFGLGGLPDFMLELEVLAGSALGVGSVLDGTALNPGTSDPTTVLAAAPSDRVTLLEVGPVQGIDEFTGSAMVANHSPTAAQVTAEFFPRGTPGVAASASFAIAAGDVVGYEDVVGDLLGLADTVGTLVLRTTNGTEISALAREYAVFRDGQGTVTGTAGQLMPGLTDDDLLEPGTTYEFLGLVQRQDRSGTERAHLSVFNPGTSDVTVTLVLLSDQGSEEGSVQRTVRAGELLRVNSVPDQVNPTQDGGLKSLVLTTTGPVHALVFGVNTTGDPVTRPPFAR